MIDKIITQSVRIDQLIAHANRDKILKVTEIIAILDEIQEINSGAYGCIMDHNEQMVKHSQMIETYKSMWATQVSDKANFSFNLELKERECAVLNHQVKQLTKENGKLKSEKMITSQNEINKF